MKTLNATAERLAFFVDSCLPQTATAVLTPNAEPGPYALCFDTFCRKLLMHHGLASDGRGEVLRQMVRDARRAREYPANDKPYRQLLTFVLSALSILGELDADPLADLVSEQIPHSVGFELQRFECLQGRVGSGNQAMFMAIFLMHARDRLGMNTQSALDEWVDLHVRHMNRFGFWGDDRWMTHLQFQNGYHQHEILEYLGVDNPRLSDTLAAVRSLADSEGHFAPYPGGGGCYDYDAVFMLTPHAGMPDEDTRRLLEQTATSIVSEQNPDGGFCESHWVRPRSLSRLVGFSRHILAANGNFGVFKERLRYGLALQRLKHDRIHTHWSRYSRRWDESDLWDSWFRMLALARIDVALHPEHANRWGFIDYPGIGYHPSLAKQSRVV